MVMSREPATGSAAAHDCGSPLVVRTPDQCRVIYAFEPSTDEVAACQVLKMINENAVDQRPTYGAYHGHRLGGEFFGYSDSEARRHLGDESDERRSALLSHALSSQVLRRLGHRSGDARTDRKVACLRGVIALGGASEGEYLQAGQLGFRGCQVFPFASRDVRDGTQDDRGGDGQFDGQGWQPEEAPSCA